MRRPEQAPLLVVVAPDIVGKGLLAPRCRSVLERWRDGGVRPVVTVALLRVYLRLLRRLGVSDPILLRWLLWFTAEDKSTFLHGSADGPTALFEILCDAAVRGHADVILSSHGPPERAANLGTPNNVRWILVRDFVP